MKLKEKYMDKLLTFYYDNEYDMLDVGKIVFENDEYIQVKGIDSNANYDGYYILPKKNINRIEVDTEYLKSLENIKKKEELDLKFDDASILSFLKYIYDNKLKCNIKLYDIIIEAYIISLEEDKFIEVQDDKKAKYLFKIDEIISVAV